MTRSMVLLSFAVAPLAGAAFFLFPAVAAAQSEDKCLPPWVLERPHVPKGLAVDPPIDTAEACPAWRWVAIKGPGEAQCPVPAGVDPALLKSGGLFQPKELLNAGSRPVPAALRPYCFYQIKTGSSQAKQTPGEARDVLNRNLEDFLRQGRLLEVESGCAAVGPMAAWELMRDHFLGQAGHPPSMGLARQEGLTSPRVRLALLDTQPNDTWGHSKHGSTLAEMARRLLCEESGERNEATWCRAEVVSRLALPIFEFDWEDPAETTMDTTNGGFFGTIDQLAVAIQDEVENWRQLNQNKLVLNLSVAWVGELFGGLESTVSEMPLPVETVYKALQVASCRGVLVVAAAGNRLGGPELEVGPLLPAAWERRAAPTAAECIEILGDTAGDEYKYPTGEGEPLVYAVAGIQSDGAPLANARPGSEPERVAYADHAVVAYADQEVVEGKKIEAPTAVMTGSSVATTVVAAAAAAVWGKTPDLSRAQVMEKLYQSGDGLKRTAEVHLGTPREVKRITVCSALTGARGRSCPDGEPCSGDEPGSCSWNPELPKLSDEVACISTTARRIDVDKDFQDSMTGNAFCKSSTLHYNSKNGHPKDTCPGRQFFTIKARPWTGPQPQEDPCSTCGLRPPPPNTSLQGIYSSESPTLQLRLNIDSDWSGPALIAPILSIGGVGYALGLDTLQKGECVIVEGIDTNLMKQDDDLPHAYLHFRTQYGSITSPLFIGY